MKEVGKIAVYMKPEESKAYYVVHDTGGDSVDLEEE